MSLLHDPRLRAGPVFLYRLHATALRSGGKAVRRAVRIYNMFFHLEHHLFPGVPTIKLPALAKRIRQQLPDLRAKEVF